MRRELPLRNTAYMKGKFRTIPGEPFTSRLQEYLSYQSTNWANISAGTGCTPIELLLDFQIFSGSRVPRKISGTAMSKNRKFDQDTYQVSLLKDDLKLFMQSIRQLAKQAKQESPAMARNQTCRLRRHGLLWSIRGFRDKFSLLNPEAVELHLKQIAEATTDRQKATLELYLPDLKNAKQHAQCTSPTNFHPARRIRRKTNLVHIKSK